ncbi:MAG: hypothetical protein ABID38_00095 [Candidatus Diapherotrites archaeon]
MFKKIRSKIGSKTGDFFAKFRKTKAPVEKVIERKISQETLKNVTEKIDASMRVVLKTIPEIILVNGDRVKINGKDIYTHEGEFAIKGSIEHLNGLRDAILKSRPVRDLLK